MKPQSKHNDKWSTKQLEKGLCRFCKNPHLENQKTCTIHYLKVMAKSGLNSRDYWEQLYMKLEEQDFKCYLTGRELTLGLNASIDHIVPISQSKDLKNDINNIKWCDWNVNRMKTNLSTDEFVKICKEVAENN